MKQTFWTYVLAGDSLTIDSTFGFKNLSMELIGGNATFIGSGQGNGSLGPSAISLIEGNPVTISTGSTNTIEGLTIDASAGSVNIIAF